LSGSDGFIAVVDSLPVDQTLMEERNQKTMVLKASVGIGILLVTIL
jgi:hypothetical protein